MLMYALFRPSKDRPQDLIDFRSSHENLENTVGSIELHPLPKRKVNRRTLLRGIAIGIGFATFMILWGALNVWTGKAFYVGKESEMGNIGGPRRIVAGFVTREEAPPYFWMVVGFKFAVGTLSLATYLYILGNAYWKRWRLRVGQNQPGE